MNKDDIKSSVKNLLPASLHPMGKSILRFYHTINGVGSKFRMKIHYAKIHHSYARNLKRLNTKISSGNETIRCVYFALFDSVWKCDGLYQLMQTDSRFEPIVLVCPVVNYGRDNMLKRMEACYQLMKSKGYNVIKAYDVDTDSYVDVNKELHPDIIVYTNPYAGLIDGRYYIRNFEQILTIYIPYFFGLNIYFRAFDNQYLHNIVWRLYCETDTHKGYYLKYQDMKGKNVVTTGYPGIDRLLTQDFTVKTQEMRKTIIWAPHHSISPVGKVNFSCFIKYSDFMLSLAEKFQNEVQFIFKPHPLLKNKLYEAWGGQKTDEYYHKWETMPNTSLQDGEYIGLFLTSDAMIHDSGSFLMEYLYTRKPVMRTMNDIDPKTMYNDFALDALEVYYKAYSEQDIEKFIQNVICGIDPKKDAREEFFREQLLPPNGELPSINIMNDIVDSIENLIVHRN